MSAVQKAYILKFSTSWRGVTHILSKSIKLILLVGNWQHSLLLLVQLLIQLLVTGVTCLWFFWWYNDSAWDTAICEHSQCNDTITQHYHMLAEHYYHSNLNKYKCSKTNGIKKQNNWILKAIEHLVITYNSIVTNTIFECNVSNAMWWFVATIHDQIAKFVQQHINQSKQQRKHYEAK